MASAPKKRIRKRDGTAVWDVRYYANGQAHTRTLSTLAEARAFASDIETDKRRGTWRDPALGRQTIGDWLDHYLEVACLGWRLETNRKVRQMVRNQIKPFLGHVQLANLSKARVRSWHAELARHGRSTAMILEAHKTLRLALSLAVDDDVLAANVAKQVRPPKHDQRPPIFLASTGDVFVLVECMEPRYRAMIFLGALSGLRIGEMIDLRRRDVDLVRGTIYVPGTKTENSRRTIRMHRLVHDALAGHIGRYVTTDSVDALIFTSPRGRPLNQHNFGRDFWHRAREAAGHPQLHFHDLRHSAASFAAMAGAHPTAVQALLGHARVGVTLSMYTHLWPGAVDSAIEAVDALFAVEPRPSS